MTAAAYKLMLLLKVRADLEPAAFSDQWLTLEARKPLVAPGLIAHVFDRPCRLTGAPIENAANASYDAAQETWWARKNDAANWFVSHEFRSWLANRLPILAGQPDAIGGQPDLLWERDVASDPTGAAKVIILPVARRRLTVQQFASYWAHSHAQLALAGPGAKERLIRLEITPAQTTPTPFAKTRFDGAGAVTFESTQAVNAEFSSEYYKNRLAPDELEFTDPDFSTAFVTLPVVLR